MNDLTSVYPIAVRNGTNKQSMIIQYEKNWMLSKIRAIVETYKHPNAHSFVSRFIDIDVFVNFNNDDKLPWQNIIYEGLENNHAPSAHNRYSDVPIILITEDMIRSDRFKLIGR